MWMKPALPSPGPLSGSLNAGFEQFLRRSLACPLLAGTGRARMALTPCTLSLDGRNPTSEGYAREDMQRALQERASCTCNSCSARTNLISSQLVRAGGNTMSKTWQVQDAKARFSEMLRASLAHGPQIVTRRGVESAVLVPIEQWRRLQPMARPNLKELLLAPEPRTETLTPPRGVHRLRRSQDLA